MTKSSAVGSATPAQLAAAVFELLSGQSHPEAALATVIRRSGSAPQVVGARMLLYADGSTLGTVGGGAIEHQVLETCRQVLRTGKPRTVEAHLVRDLGMCCGGAMEVFVEYLQAESRLIIVGGGHVAQALAPLARGIGLRVIVADDREELLEDPAFEQVERLAFDADEIHEAIPDLNERDYIVIVTRDHARDERALAKLIELPHAYLGMIGSRRKVHTVLARVLRRYDERGRARPDLSRVHAPVGLALGGRTPPEIAVSIAAELIALRHGGDGSSMNMVDAAIGRVS
ncbi:Xanthine and CO dehydrogenases maturation factor, XdhC/CoxF family protein [Enhygromyxa salina]|uniref:Xanthine and CO dehydrogenases maturation factor, XdhC/CoxF family protein n=1 Tax=Enhygromyxa salina TaxID=215803 RepID=A0A0C2D0X2_9BACT|nr:XdhC/CoxI family protein [Enhygromyxa salina]KIG13787.1 Xanthine and CO dehydrogenases maturation factor, XdhC/CoxF family protein [Enhygromyxa salina]